MSSANELSDGELRNELTKLGFNAGPVTATTRKIYEKKLETLRKNAGTRTLTKIPTSQPNKGSPVKSFASPPPLITTPLSAKRKGRKVQPIDTESSDNELELTVTTDNGSPVATRSARSTANRRVLNELVPAMDHSPPRSNVSKRTPTPPRSGSVNKRTPLRYDPNATTLSQRGNIFASNGGENSVPSIFNASTDSVFSSPPITNTSNSYFYNPHSLASNEKDDDDHMETSRVIPRYRDFRDSARSVYGSSPRPRYKESSMDKLRRFSRDAWGFFSRPTNSGTPCAGDLYTKPGNLRYSRYSKYSPRPSLGSSTKSNETCDVSGWILIIGASFLVILLTLYVLYANPETIERTKSTVMGVTLATLNFFYAYLILPISLLAGTTLLGFGGIQLHKFREVKKAQRKNRLMALVDRITDIIRDNEAEGIAESHVRDILMPPTKRSVDDWKLWREAAEFINLEDSRVRTEVRLLDGVECNVWAWVPTATKQKWQGTAIAESSLAHNIPTKALARCIKLRGISFTGRNSEMSDLREELLYKLSPVVPVHMDFTVAPENIVYLMLKDLDDAKNAFMAFHSHWFKGGMISAKYVRDERYMERFPEAARLYN